MTVDELSTFLDEIHSEGYGDSEISIPSPTGGNMPLDESVLVIEDQEWKSLIY